MIYTSIGRSRYHATVNLGDTVAVASQRSHSKASDMLHREHQLWSEAKDLEGNADNNGAQPETNDEILPDMRRSS